MDHETLVMEPNGQLALKTNLHEVWDSYRWRRMTDEDTRDRLNEFLGRETENPGMIFKDTDSYRPLSRVEAMRWLIFAVIPVELQSDFLALLDRKTHD